MITQKYVIMFNSLKPTSNLKKINKAVFDNKPQLCMFKK